MIYRLRVCVFACVAVALAQAPVGSLTGTAHDASGGVMPGVAITVTNQDTGLQRRISTSTEELLSAASLPAGNYTVTATAEGFHTLERDATVQAGQVTIYGGSADGNRRGQRGA
jgi:hypothetical protein